jgi:4-phytase/acid phosphatase
MSVSGLRLLAPLALALGIAGVAQAEPVLERVVLVARHGVRAPTASLEALQAQTGRVWPGWPVGPGELTPHGAETLGRMADFVRAVYARDGLLPEAACPAPGVVQVWADGADQRTRESGAVWARTLNCGIPARHGPDGESDALFDAAGMGVCPVDPKAESAAISAATHDEADLVRPGDLASLEALQAIVAPDGCAGGPGPCFKAPTGLATGKAGLKLTGPLAVGSTLAENLLLEYAQGLPLDQVGWGRLGASEGAVERSLAAVLPAHDRAASLMRQTPYLASHNGAILARTVLDLLQGKAPQDAHAPPLSAAARLTVIAGHDTNLSNLAGVFGLSWALPDEPDATAPDTTLAFEVWRDGAVETVRVVVYSQSLRDLRTAAALDQTHPAGVTPGPLPDCGGGVCKPETLAAAVTRRLPQDCRP